MSFLLRLHDDQTTGLVAVCDSCGQLVGRSEEANLCWDGFEDSKGNPLGREFDKPGDLFEFRLCHKKCMRHMDGKYGHQFTQELDVALIYLLNNTKTAVAKAKQRALILNQL